MMMLPRKHLVTALLVSLLVHFSIAFSNAMIKSSVSVFPSRQLHSSSSSRSFQSTQQRQKIPTSHLILNSSNKDLEYASSDILLGTTGTLSSLVCLYSLYILRTTSCGLPPGPFGLLGAAEGVSYLIIVYIFFLALKEKITTGSGLPAGKYNLLGLAEGLSFIIVFSGLAIAVLNYNDFGFLPGFLPNDNCFGIND